MQEYTAAIDRLLRRPEVQELTGLARASIYQKMATGDFPRPVKIGARAVAWPLSVIADWIERRKRECDLGAGERTDPRPPASRHLDE